MVLPFFPGVVCFLLYSVRGWPIGHVSNGGAGGWEALILRTTPSTEIAKPHAGRPNRPRGRFTRGLRRLRSPPSAPRPAHSSSTPAELLPCRSPPRSPRIAPQKILRRRCPSRRLLPRPQPPPPPASSTTTHRERFCRGRHRFAPPRPQPTGARDRLRPGELVPAELSETLRRMEGLPNLASSPPSPPPAPASSLCSSAERDTNAHKVFEPLPARESPEATTMEGAHCTIQVPPESGCGQSIFVLPSDDWGIMFYIRKDRWGYFHTYPRVCGPFQSLQEAENGINSYLLERQDPNMFVGGVSDIEMRAIRRIYWPDGTKKMSPEFYPVDITRDWMHQLSQSLVDKYNEDHNLVEDLAYQLKKVVCLRSICEVDIFTWCYHINFTAQNKGVGHTEDLFFAEVISKGEGELEELVPSCLCMLTPIDNGTCHGCINNGGSDDMRHPRDASVYTGGHARDAFLPFGGVLPPATYSEPPPVHDFDFAVAEETRLRNLFTALKHIFTRNT